MRYDPTIAPICKGKSNCPTQFGRKPGIIAEPATGFIFAFQLPVGNPNDASYVLPLVDKVQQHARVAGRQAPHPSHPLAGWGSGLERLQVTGGAAYPGDSHRRYPAHGRAAPASTDARGHPPDAGRGWLEQKAHPSTRGRSPAPVATAARWSKVSSLASCAVGRRGSLTKASAGQPCKWE